MAFLRLMRGCGDMSKDGLEAMQENSVQQAEIGRDEGEERSLLLRAEVSSNIAHGRWVRQQARTVSERLSALWRNADQ